MIVFPRSVRVYVGTYPVNLRKSFNGLMCEVRSNLGRDPLNGHVYVFLNRRKTMVKILVWTRGGFTIISKRLEKGCFTFHYHLVQEEKSIQIQEHELSMLLEGIDIRRARQSARWSPRQKEKKAQ